MPHLEPPRETTGWPTLRPGGDVLCSLPLITAGGFPAFTADGAPVTDPPERVAALADRMTTRLAVEAGRQLPGRLAVQSNGLVGNAPPDPATIEDAREAGAMLA